MIKAVELIRALKKAGLITKGEVTRGVRYAEGVTYTRVMGRGMVDLDEETFGDRSIVFCRCRGAEAASRAVQVIKSLGGKPDFKWCSDQPHYFSLDISPIKGYHNWE